MSQQSGSTQPLVNNGHSGAIGVHGHSLLTRNTSYYLDNIPRPLSRSLSCTKQPTHSVDTTVLKCVYHCNIGHDLQVWVPEATVAFTQLVSWARVTYTRTNSCCFQCNPTIVHHCVTRAPTWFGWNPYFLLENGCTTPYKSVQHVFLLNQPILCNYTVVTMKVAYRTVLIPRHWTSFLIVQRYRCPDNAEYSHNVYNSNWAQRFAFTITCYQWHI